jgi:hypothetical protein
MIKKILNALVYWLTLPFVMFIILTAVPLNGTKKSSSHATLVLIDNFKHVGKVIIFVILMIVLIAVTR